MENERASISGERVSRSPNSVINSMTRAERREHMRKLGKAAHASRVILNGEERRTLVEAFLLLDRIVKRHGLIEGEGDNAPAPWGEG